MSTFHRTKACWIGLLLLGLYSAPAWPQSASLVGHVYDNKDGSGIVGVDVTVTGSDGKVQPTKVSSTGGVFEVDGLTPGTAITVVFKKLGYCPYPKPDPVNLIGTQNQHDVFLYQDTEDLRYWDTLSHRVTSRIQAQGGDPTARSQRFVREWDKVDGAGLSVAAKVRAAQAFSQVKPSDIQVPAGLGA